MDPLEKVGGAHADLTLDARGFVRGVDDGVGGLQKLERAGKQTGQDVSKNMDKIGTASLIAGAAIAAGIGHAIAAFSSFENRMNAVSAVTGATGAELDKLKDKALDIGKATVFSAAEAANAMEELGKAGLSVTDILAGAADGAIALAAAAGQGVAESAAQMAESLNVFKLGGDAAMHVADVFAAAASKTNAQAAGIADGISNASAIFSLLNIPIEVAAGTLALFNDNAIKGAEAGTALKSTMIALLSPTDEQSRLMKELGIDLFDVNGEFIGMEALSQQLQDGLGGLTQEQRTLNMAILGGSYGIRGLNVLYQAGAAGIAEYTDLVDDEGSAAEQAAIRNAGLAGAIESLSGSIETAEIAFGEGLAPAVEAVAVGIQKLVDMFTSLSPGVQKFIGFFLVGTAGVLLFVGATIKLTLATRGMMLAVRGVIPWLIGQGAAQTTVATTGNVAAASVSRLTLAARGLMAALGPLAIAMAAVAAVKFAGDLDKAIDKGGTPGMVGTAETWGIKAGRAFGWAFGKVGADSIANSLDENMDDRELGNIVANKLVGFGFELDTNHGLLTNFESEIEGFGLTVGELIDYADRAGITIEQALLRFARGMNVTTPAVAKLGEEVRELDRVAAEFAANTPSMTPQFAGAGAPAAEQLSAEAFAAEQAAAALNERNIAIQEGIAAAVAKAAADEITLEIQQALNTQYIEQSGLILPLTRNQADVAKATADFNEKLRGQVRGTAEATSGLIDLSSELPGLQSGYGKVGDSIFDMLLAADRAGDLDLNWSDREAFGVAAGLADIRGNIDRVSEAIANNQQDLSMWEGRIALVDSVLGSNRDTLAEWEQQLAAGAVTQEEFNAAVADGRAVRAFDELKTLYDEGRLSLDEYNEILQAGTWLRERSVGGVQDEKAEIAKLIPDLAEYVRLHDEENRSLEDLTPAQRGRIAALQGENAQMLIQTALLVKMLVAMGQISEEEGAALLIDLTQFDSGLQQALIDYGFIKSDIEENPPKVGIQWETTSPSELKSILDSGGSGGANLPITTPPVDTTEMRDSLDEMVRLAGEKGVEAGEAVGAGLESGGAAIPAAAGNVAVDGLNVLGSYGSDYYNSGWNSGYSYTAGLITGMNYLANELYASARNLAKGVEQSSRREMEANSPSNKAAEIMRDWNRGYLIGASDTSAVELEARRAAFRIQTAARDSFQASDTRANGASSTPFVVQAGANIQQTIAPVFQGITDTQEIIGAVNASVEDGFLRLEQEIN